jgi:hypothetical protein
MALEGVKIGPLDPDRGEMFGQVGANSTARQLIRHHAAMHPPALVAALSRVRQAVRSDALDRAELDSAVADYYAGMGEALPDGAIIDGAAVRGEDDGRQQVVTFTWLVPVSEGGSGRSGKGFIPYDADHLPNSVAAGNDAVRIAKLKEAGLPWHPEAVSREVAGIAGTGVSAGAGEEMYSAGEMQTLRDEIERLRAQIADIEATPQPLASSAGGGSGVAASPMTAEGGSALVPGTRGPDSLAAPEGEPWEGYDGTNADDVRKRLRDSDDPELARRVLSFEQAHANRGTVISLANQIIDRP